LGFKSSFKSCVPNKIFYCGTHDFLDLNPESRIELRVPNTQYLLTISNFLHIKQKQKKESKKRKEEEKTKFLSVAEKTMASAEEDEVMAEVEAVQAVYGDDCVILQSYPPHLHLHIKPRTADVTSQQFVEAVIEIRAGSKYPEEVPHIDLIDSKGFDEQRQQELITCIRDKACELSCYLMLVSLCEEAVEKLSIMNHPDGDCPLCLYPLVPEDEKIKILPFMKLMSCFHCFHSECIIRWWNWLQTEKEAHAVDSSSVTIRPSSFMGNEKGILV
jgi:hypothetical protein